MRIQKPTQENDNEAETHREIGTHFEGENYTNKKARRVRSAATWIKNENEMNPVKNDRRTRCKFNTVEMYVRGVNRGMWRKPITMPCFAQLQYGAFTSRLL